MYATFFLFVTAFFGYGLYFWLNISIVRPWAGRNMCVRPARGRGVTAVGTYALCAAVIAVLRPYVPFVDMLFLLATCGILAIVFICPLRNLYWGALHMSLHIACVTRFSSAAIGLMWASNLFHSPHMLSEQFANVLTSLVLLLLFLYVSKRVRILALFERFQEFPRQMHSIACFGSLLFLYQSLCREPFYNNPSDKWLAVLFLSGSVLTLRVYYLMLDWAAQSCALAKEDWKVHILQEQLSKQLMHYQAYQKYTESIRAFEHDYESAMGAVNGLLHQGEKTGALRLLEQMDLRMQEDIVCHHPYSNHMLVDAILQDVGNECMNGNIAFSADVFLPPWFTYAQLEVYSLFSNLCSNATEACARMEPQASKSVRIKSSVEGEWLLIVVQNTFNGAVKLQNGNLVSDKSAQGYYSTGIAIMKRLVEEKGGFLRIEIDKAHKLFKMSVFICRPQAGEATPCN